MGVSGLEEIYEKAAAGGDRGGQDGGKRGQRNKRSREITEHRGAEPKPTGALSSVAGQQRGGPRRESPKKQPW